MEAILSILRAAHEAQKDDELGSTSAWMSALRSVYYRQILSYKNIMKEANCCTDVREPTYWRIMRRKQKQKFGSYLNFEKAWLARL